MGGDAEPHEAARLAARRPAGRTARRCARGGTPGARRTARRASTSDGRFRLRQARPLRRGAGAARRRRRPTSGYGASGPTAGAKISRRGSGANEAEKPIGESKCSPRLRQTPSPPPIAPPRTAGDAATVCGQTPRERPNSGQTDERIGRFEKNPYLYALFYRIRRPKALCPASGN